MEEILVAIAAVSSVVALISSIFAKLKKTGDEDKNKNFKVIITNSVGEVVKLDNIQAEEINKKVEEAVQSFSNDNNRKVSSSSD